MSKLCKVISDSCDVVLHLTNIERKVLSHLMTNMNKDDNSIVINTLAIYIMSNNLHLSDRLVSKTIKDLINNTHFILSNVDDNNKLYINPKYAIKDNNRAVVKRRIGNKVSFTKPFVKTIKF